MKSITVYGSDEIIDDIKATAHKLQTSASRYLLFFHIVQQENKYPGKVRGSQVSGEIAKDFPPAKMAKGEKASEWSGGISKTQQTGKK